MHFLDKAVYVQANNRTYEFVEWFKDSTFNI